MRGQNLQTESPEDAQKKAEERYLKLKGPKDERLVSGSDDFTLFMWDPKNKKESVRRMTGHQQPVNHVNW